MPARRERVYICPDQCGQPVWIVEFPFWWDRGGFFEKFGQRMIDTGNPFYSDFGLLLTSGEACAWDQQCREKFAGDPQGESVHAVEVMHRWETMLKAAGWVIVESSEWESGMA